MTTVTNKDGIEFDIDALATDVNGKADKDLVNVSSNVSVCIESWHEGTEWYRVYSDGWCEQGGTNTANTVVRTISFKKPFIDTNYTALSNKFGNYTGTSAVVSMIVSKSTDSMQINNANTDYPTCIWEAKGYIR